MARLYTNPLEDGGEADLEIGGRPWWLMTDAERAEARRVEEEHRLEQGWDIPRNIPFVVGPPPPLQMSGGGVYGFGDDIHEPDALEEMMLIRHGLSSLIPLEAFLRDGEVLEDSEQGEARLGEY